MPRQNAPYFDKSGGFVNKNVAKRLKALRKLPIYNRNTGGEEIKNRRKGIRQYSKNVSSIAYNYPTNSGRTLSLSRKSFTNQTKNLKGSQYFIDQFRGTLQDNYNLNRSRKKYYLNRDILSRQAKIIREKEENEKLEPLQQYFRNSPSRRVLNDGETQYEKQ